MAVDDHAEQPAVAFLDASRNGGNGGGLDVPLGHHRIDQAERLGASSAHVAPGQHHGHRFERVDEPRQAHRAAEAGMQAEHDLGQAEPRLLDRDAIVAGERDLEPAAEAIAVDDGDGGRAEVIEPVDHRVRLRQARLDRGDVGHAAELVDVGAGDEARRLGGAQHHAPRQTALEARERVVQFGEHVLRQGVGARARLVEDEPGDVVLVARERPVAPGRAAARQAGERTQLEIARRENVPDFTHLQSIIVER
jgi:hypothetical protein